MLIAESKQVVAEDQIEVAQIEALDPSLLEMAAGGSVVVNTI